MRSSNGAIDAQRFQAQSMQAKEIESLKAQAVASSAKPTWNCASNDQRDAERDADGENPKNWQRPR
jgi:hypothetical protein